MEHTCSFTQTKHYFSDRIKMSKINLKWSRMEAKSKSIKKKEVTVKILPSSNCTIKYLPYDKSLLILLDPISGFQQSPILTNCLLY